MKRSRNASLHPGGSYWIWYILPALVVYCMFMAYPLFDSIRLSLYTGSSANREFVGFDNFVRLFTDEFYSSLYLNAFKNNTIFFMIHMLVQNVLGLLFANILTSARMRGRKMYQAIIFAPVTFAIVVTGYIWKLLLSPTWTTEPLTGIGLQALAQPWLGREGTALIVISLVSCWQWVGIPTVLFVVGMQNISEDLYEAAYIDGASVWQIFWKIKLPLLKPVVGIVAILTFVNNYNAFDIIVSMANLNGYPLGATDLLGTLFYRIGIGGQHPLGIPNPGMGAAIATITFVFLAVISFVVLRATRTKE